MEGLGIVAQGSLVLDAGDGQSYELSPLTLRDWASLEQQAVADYKRELIKTFTENADLLPADMRQQEIRAAFARAEQITIATLPKVSGKVPRLDTSGIPILGASGEFEMIDGELPYIQNWLDSFAGRLHSVWLSLRRKTPTLTIDQASEIFARAGAKKLAEAASAVASISRSKLKNSDPAPDAAPAAGQA